MKTFYIQIHDQNITDGGIENGTPMVDVKTTTYTDILHVEDNQVEKLEKVAKPWKHQEGASRFITTKVTEFDPDAETTIDYDSAMSMLINWTE